MAIAVEARGRDVVATRSPRAASAHRRRRRRMCRATESTRARGASLIGGYSPKQFGKSLTTSRQIEPVRPRAAGAPRCNAACHAASWRSAFPPNTRPSSSRGVALARMASTSPRGLSSGTLWPAPGQGWVRGSGSGSGWGQGRGQSRGGRKGTGGGIRAGGWEKGWEVGLGLGGGVRLGRRGSGWEVGCGSGWGPHPPRCRRRRARPCRARRRAPPPPHRAPSSRARRRR